jgi:Flp pilus assembly pilin Flp
MRMKDTQMKLAKKKARGASMVEYAILIAVIAGAALAALNIFGPKLSEAFTSVGSKVTNAAK